MQPGKEEEPKLKEFVAMIARLSRPGDETVPDAEDAISTMRGLILKARKLVAGHEAPLSCGDCGDCAECRGMD